VTSETLDVHGPISLTAADMHDESGDFLRECFVQLVPCQRLAHAVPWVKVHRSGVVAQRDRVRQSHL
jgi:hypothetical protein